MEVPVETVPAAARTRPSERELLAPHIEQKPVKKGSHAEKQKAPPWGWGFCAACLAIMIVTRGGAIWGALGGGVGGLCLKVAQAQSLPVPLRIVICTAVTAALWVGIVMLVLSLAG